MFRLFILLATAVAVSAAPPYIAGGGWVGPPRIQLAIHVVSLCESIYPATTAGASSMAALVIPGDTEQVDSNNFNTNNDGFFNILHSSCAAGAWAASRVYSAKLGWTPSSPNFNPTMDAENICSQAAWASNQNNFNSQFGQISLAHITQGGSLAFAQASNLGNFFLYMTEALDENEWLSPTSVSKVTASDIEAACVSGFGAFADQFHSRYCSGPSSAGLQIKFPPAAGVMPCDGNSRSKVGKSSGGAKTSKKTASTTTSSTVLVGVGVAGVVGGSVVAAGVVSKLAKSKRTRSSGAAAPTVDV